MCCTAHQHLCGNGRGFIQGLHSSALGMSSKIPLLKGQLQTHFLNLLLSRPYFAGFFCPEQIGELSLIILQPPLRGSLLCPLQDFRLIPCITAVPHSGSQAFPSNAFCISS